MIVICDLKPIRKSCILLALTLYSIKRLKTPFIYQIFESIIENGAFTFSEQMLHFP